MLSGTLVLLELPSSQGCVELQYTESGVLVLYDALALDPKMSTDCGIVTDVIISSPIDGLRIRLIEMCKFCMRVISFDCGICHGITAEVA